MFLGITTIGWVIYLVVFVPGAAAAIVGLDFVVRRIWTAPRVRAALLAPLAIPLVGYPVLEAQYSEWQMRKACRDAPGLVVYQRVVVAGYFDEHTRTTPFLVNPEPDPEWMARAVKVQKESGYRFKEFEVEPDRFGGGFLREELTPDDKIRLIKLDRPMARYRFTRSKESVIGLHVLRREQYIMDTETGKPIASDIRVYRKASFIDRFWLRFLGPAENVAGCRLPSNVGFAQEIDHILIPIDKQH